MLMAEAVRLAAIEILCPTAALLTEANYPTLAGSRVLDSRELKVNELEDHAPFTPVLALFSSTGRQENRGGVAGGLEYDSQCVLEVVGELAIAQTDPDDPEAGLHTDALAGTDPEARLVLKAMLSQAKYRLEQSLEGSFFRRLVRSIRRVDEETFSVPELGMRWQRITHRYTLDIGDECFDDETGKPRALEILVSELPEQSYAKGKIQQLFDNFTAPLGPVLHTPDVMLGGGEEISDRKGASE